MMLPFSLESREIENCDNFMKEGIENVPKDTETGSVLILMQRNIKIKELNAFLFLNFSVFQRRYHQSVDKGNIIQ